MVGKYFLGGAHSIAEVPAATRLTATRQMKKGGAQGHAKKEFWLFA
jgi:hypothetical protein